MSAEQVRQSEIDELATQIHRVLSRNPHRTVAHLLAFVTRNSGTFLPEDAPDSHVLARLRSVGANDRRSADPGQLRPPA